MPSGCQAKAFALGYKEPGALKIHAFTGKHGCV